MLGKLELAAKSPEVKQMFSHHAEETRQQIANLERIFQLLDLPTNDSPSPATKGLTKGQCDATHDRLQHDR